MRHKNSKLSDIGAVRCRVCDNAWIVMASKCTVVIVVIRSLHCLLLISYIFMRITRYIIY